MGIARTFRNAHLFSRSTQATTWRRPQIPLHLAIVSMIVTSLIPVYLMISISFKNPIQYQHERWLLSFPLRLGNYAAAWDIVAPYLVNTLIVAVIGFVGTVFFTVALIFLNHVYLPRHLPRAVRPGWLNLFFLSLSCLAYVILAVLYILTITGIV